jgi:hypothetical protein
MINGLAYHNGEFYKQFDDLHGLKDRCGCCYRLFDKDKDEEYVNWVIWEVATEDDYYKSRTSQEIYDFIRDNEYEITEIAEGFHHPQEVWSMVRDSFNYFLDSSRENRKEGDEDPPENPFSNTYQW